jgi:hypothetical protein
MRSSLFLLQFSVPLIRFFSRIRYDTDTDSAEFAEWDTEPSRRRTHYPG